MTDIASSGQTSNIVRTAVSRIERIMPLIQRLRNERVVRVTFGVCKADAVLASGRRRNPSRLDAGDDAVPRPTGRHALVRCLKWKRM